MKRILAVIALVIGSLVLPLSTGDSLAAKPHSASAVSSSSAPRKRVLAIVPTPLTKKVRAVATPVSTQAKIPHPVSSSAPRPNPSPSPHNPSLAATVPPRIPSSWSGPAPTLVVRDAPPKKETAPVFTDGLKAVDSAQMEERHRVLAKRVLGLLPRDCQEKLVSFSVLYDNPKHRGLAGKGVIILAGNVPDNEFIGLLMHEGLGHFADLTCFNGTPQSGDSSFIDAGEMMFRNDPSVAFYSISWSDSTTKKQDTSPADFVSGYALSDVFEDFGESVAYYFLQEEAFAQRAQSNAALAQKLSWLRAHYPKNNVSITGAPWNNKIPWDATRVTYNW